MKFILCIFLCLTLINFKNDYLKVELKDDIKDYDKVLKLLFDLEAVKKQDKIYLVKGENIQKFIEIAANLPYIKSINNIKNNKITKEESKKIFIKFATGTNEESIESLETFFSLKDKKYNEIIDTYSYSVNLGIEINKLIEYLKSFPFVIHVEEDSTMKIFF